MGESSDEAPKVPKIRVEDGIIVKRAMPFRKRATRKLKDPRKIYEAL